MALTTVKTTALNGTITNAQLAGSIDLTAKVTGTLPIANGGTNSTSTTFVNAATNVTGTLATGNGGTGSTATTFVNVASNVTGTLPAANGGTGVTSYAPGKIGQVIQKVITAGSVTHTTTAFIATAWLVAITPSATSSNIHLSFSVNQGCATANRSPNFRIYRDIGGGGYSHLTNGVDGEPHDQSGSYANVSGHFATNSCFQFYDDPATTSECTYKVYFKLSDTTGSCYAYAAAGLYGYATAMEVLA